MIGEAVDAAVTLGWALAAWIAVGAVAVTVVLYAVVGLLVLVGRWAWKALTRAYAAASRTNTPSRDSRAADTAPGPSPGRSEPHDWKATA